MADAEKNEKAQNEERAKIHAAKIERLEILKHRPVLSKAEYNELTGISIPAITRLALIGEIPSIKIGRSRRLINNLYGAN